MRQAAVVFARCWLVWQQVVGAKLFSVLFRCWRPVEAFCLFGFFIYVCLIQNAVIRRSVAAGRLRHLETGQTEKSE